VTPSKNSAQHTTTAILAMHRAKEACTHLRLVGAGRRKLSDGEVRMQAQMMDKVLRAREKMQQLKDRADALENALSRFTQRRDVLRAEAVDVADLHKAVA
jgi:hypothetical protein